MNLYCLKSTVRKKMNWNQKIFRRIKCLAAGDADSATGFSLMVFSISIQWFYVNMCSDDEKWMRVFVLIICKSVIIKNEKKEKKERSQHRRKEIEKSQENKIQLHIERFIVLIYVFKMFDYAWIEYKPRKIVFAGNDLCFFGSWASRVPLPQMAIELAFSEKFCP